MAWTTDLVLMSRVLVNDLDDPQKYTDTYLQRVLIVAGIQVKNEVELSYTYTFDIDGLTISPDPMTSEDYVFQALVPLKTACILAHSNFQQALGQGIKVRDGDSAIDTSVSFRGYRDILIYGPCAAYEKLKWQILASDGIGSAVLGPYRIPAGNALNTISWFYDSFATDVSKRRDRT